MSVEIERKFRVKGDQWRASDRTEHIRQVYLVFGPPASVRIRIAGQTAFITIKARKSALERHEFEYEIPLEEGVALLELAHEGSIIEKTRHYHHENGVLWEVDVFHGDNEGLIVAEVELDRADQHVDLPAWIGEEVSHDSRYFNSNLARHPFRAWRA